MAQDVGEGDALVGLDHQALPDQVLALGGEADAEAQLRPTDLVVRLEGDVTADHVEQEDAEGPDGGFLSIIAGVANPLRRGIHSGSCKEKETKYLGMPKNAQKHGYLFITVTPISEADGRPKSFLIVQRGSCPVAPASFITHCFAWTSDRRTVRCPPPPTCPAPASCTKEEYSGRGLARLTGRTGGG